MPPASRPARRCAPRRAVWPSGRGDWRRLRRRSARRAPAWISDEAGLGALCAAGGRWREAPGVRPARSVRKPFTIRSSSEWKVTTASRPPLFSTRSAASSPRSSSSSSSLTAIRAPGTPGWPDGPWRPRRPPRARSTTSARSSVRSNGRSARRRTMRAGDPAGLTLLADSRGRCASARPGSAVVDQIGGGRALGAHAHVQRAVAHEGKAALGLVQLHGGDAEVEGHAVGGRRAQRRRPCARTAPGSGAGIARLLQRRGEAARAPGSRSKATTVAPRSRNARAIAARRRKFRR